MKEVLGANIEDEPPSADFAVIEPINDVNDLTPSSLPASIPEDVASQMITNARRLLDNSQIREAFNSEDYEVPCDDTDRALTITITKNGSAVCKRNEFLHFNM